MEKVEKFGWAKLGDHGQQCLVPIGELLIDHSYQRPELGPRVTSVVARNFNWAAFGSLVVMQRPNGDKYVVDGQQRLMAARQRGDVDKVPCVVFQSDGPGHEALAFIELNVNRKNVSAQTKWRAAVMAGRDPEREISEWIAEHGMEINENSNRDGVMDFPALIINHWRWNSDVTKRAILIQREIGGDVSMSSRIHKGLFCLLNNNVPIDMEISKMQLEGGRRAILSAIRAWAIESQAQAGDRVCARGILNVVNRGRRKKIVMPS